MGAITDISVEQPRPRPRAAQKLVQRALHPVRSVASTELPFDPALTRRVVEALHPLLKRYFRGEVRGLHNLPAGQTLIVANHDGGMLPIDAMLFGAEWHLHHHFQRRLHFLVHDVVLFIMGPYRQGMREIGCVLADRHNLDAALDEGHSVFIYPGGSRETFRSFWERKTVTLGGRTGFVRHALRRRVPITPVVSAGAHETFFVLWSGGWLAKKLGLPQLLRADVLPIVAGLPFGVWFGGGLPHLPLPAKLTMQVLPPIDLYAEVTSRLGRPLRDPDLDDPALIASCFERVRSAMQAEMDRLYDERRLPVLG